jgi:hypothetical protein
LAPGKRRQQRFDDAAACAVSSSGCRPAHGAIDVAPMPVTYSAIFGNEAT